MKRIISVILSAVLLTVMLSVPAYAYSEKNAVASIELAGERNTPSDPKPKDLGWAGAAFKVGEKDIVITAVGRMFFSDANIFHSVLVVNADGSLLNESPITVQGYDDSVDGTFEYYYLGDYEYITLQAGKTYYICSDFYGPMDHFYDSSIVESSDDLQFIGSVDLNADGTWKYTDTPGIDNLPIDFLYYVVGEEDAEVPEETEVSGAENAKPEETVPEETSAKAETKEAEDVKAEADAEAENASDSALVWKIIAVAAIIVAAAEAVLLVKRKKD